MATLTKKERAWLNELQEVLDRCPSPKKIGFYTIGDKSIYLYDLRRMDEIMEALDNRSSMDWCVAVHDMNAGFDEKILFPSSVESTAGLAPLRRGFLVGKKSPRWETRAARNKQ